MPNSRLSAVYSGLLQRGFQPPQAAALAGNIQQESSGSPTALNQASSAYGLLNWRGPRLAGLQSYAAATGRQASDPNAQLDFIVHEMQGPEASNVGAFLAAPDVPAANAALKKYIRYGNNEAGNRLNYALQFASQPMPKSNALTAANQVADTPANTPQFVNPAFSGSMPAVGAPMGPATSAAPPPAAPSPVAAPASVGGPSDDDLLNAWVTQPAADNGHPVQVDDRASQLRAATGATPDPAHASDDDLLAQFAPSAQIAPSQTPGATGNNPMAVRKPQEPTASDAGGVFDPSTPTTLSDLVDGRDKIKDAWRKSHYQPSSIPFLDQISQFGNAAANAVPVIGPALSSLGNNVDAGVNNLLAPVFGFAPETAADVANQNEAQAAKFPIANGAGAITGAVGPLVAGGATVAGGKLLGTAGNLLTRTVMGGLSSGAIGGADTLARGGSLADAGKNALLDAGMGGAMAPIGNAIAGGGKNMLLRAATGAVGGAALGGAGTLAAGGSLDQAGSNALKGAGIGAGAGIVGSAANKLLGAGASPAVAQLAQLARDKYGIPLGPGQITTNPAIRVADSVVNRMPMSGGTASRDAQLGAFNRAVSNTFGENADALTPDVMANAKSRIGAVFDSVAARTPTIKADPTFDQNMLDAMTTAQQTLTDAEVKPLSNQFDAIVGKFQQGGNSIDGATYQALTRKGAPLDRAMQSDNPNVRFAAGQMRDALDEALQRSAPADALADLQQARSQYKALKTVEPLAAKAATGTISPALLSGAVRQSYGDVAYGGGGNLAELARIGQQFLKEPANSGTPERLAAMRVLGLGGGGAGLAGLAMNPGAIPMAAVGAGGYLGASKLAGALLRSNGLANMLIRSGTGEAGPVATPGVNMLMRTAPTALSAPQDQNLLMPNGPGGPNGPLRIVVRGARAVQ